MKWLIIIWLVSLLPSSLSGRLTNNQIDLAEFVYREANKNAITPDNLIKLITCESNWDINAKGDYRSETGEYMAFGPMQWWKSSFDIYSKKYNFKGNYWNAEDQITLAVKVISNEKNGIYNWYNCSKIIGYNKKFEYISLDKKL